MRAFRVHPGMNPLERRALSRRHEPCPSVKTNSTTSMFLFRIFPRPRWQLPKRGTPNHRFRFKRIQDLRRYARRCSRRWRIGCSESDESQLTSWSGTSACDDRDAISRWTYDGLASARTAGAAVRSGQRLRSRFWRERSKIQNILHIGGFVSPKRLSELDHNGRGVPRIPHGQNCPGSS
jgi:hypothetical protein